MESWLLRAHGQHGFESLARRADFLADAIEVGAGTTLAVKSS